MASRLRSQKTGVIGVVIPLGHEKRQNISDPFLLTLLGHLADELSESGYDLMLRCTIPDETNDWLEHLTGSGLVDGVIVIGQSDQFDNIERVAQHYRPMTVWGDHRLGQTHCVVGTDNALGGRMAAEHLITSGARSLAFLGATIGIEIETRYRAAKAVAEAAGVPLAHYPIDLAAATMGGQLEDVLPGCKADGLFAASDLIAMSALRVLHQNGHKVPDGVQVVGFDDLPLASQTMPPLTTIRQEIGVGARALVEKLKARIAGEDADCHVNAPQLIVRETTVRAGHDVNLL